MKHDWSRPEAWGKFASLCLTSTAVYLAFSAFCAVCLPIDQGLAISIGVLAGFPVWIAAMCYTMLARSVVRAWVVPLALAVLLGAGATLAMYFH